MNIDHVEAFVYVVRYGSFNKAANLLFLTQPSVTARIHSLERELDCKLFDRDGKQISLTEDGRQFLPYAQQMLNIYQKGRQQLQPQTTLPDSLTIGCTVSVSNYVIADILRAVKLLHPDVSFQLVSGSTDKIVKQLLDRELDVGFVRNVSHPNLMSVKYYVDPIRLYVYADHPFVGQGHVSVEAIAQQPLVFFECGALDWIEIKNIFEKLDYPPNIPFLVDNSEAAKNIILNKSAIGFLPSVSAREEVAAGRLFEIQVAEVADTALQTNLVTMRGDHPPLVQAFLKVAGNHRFYPQPTDRRHRIRHRYVSAPASLSFEEAVV